MVIVVEDSERVKFPSSFDQDFLLDQLSGFDRKSDLILSDSATGYSLSSDVSRSRQGIRLTIDDGVNTRQ